MSLSDIISIVCAIISLVVTIIIARVQYKQGKRMEDFSKKQDEEQKKAAAQTIKAKRDSFIMKYYNDDDEIYMLPLCWISSIYDPAHAYHRKMYMEYNMLEEDVQNAICEYMNFNVMKPKNEREDFYSDCVKALEKAEYRNNVINSYRSPFYENAKYLKYTFSRYGRKALPIDLDILENRLFKLLRVYRDKTEKCPDPIEQFLHEFDYYSVKSNECDEIKDCEIIAVLSKCLTDFDIDDSEEFWIPGEYGREQISTMEDLFLCALLCIYLCLIMPKKKINTEE